MTGTISPAGPAAAVSGPGACTVTLNGNQTVTAGFSPIPVDGLLLTVRRTGKGAITSLTGNILCGTVCSDRFKYGALVTLHAQPDQGNTFMGWKGLWAIACPGRGDCTVLMNTEQTVPAEFKNTFTLILPAIQLLLE